MRRLFDYLFKNMNSEKRLGRETVFAALFPKEKYDEKKLAYAMSFLLKSAEGFLVWQSREGEGATDFQLRLAGEMRRRQLGKHFETAMRKAEKALEKEPFRHLGHHRLSHRLHRERYGESAQKRRSAVKNFQEMADETTVAFVVERLRQGCTAHMHRAVSEASYRLDLMAETLALVEGQKLFEVPAVGLYYFGYRALSEKDSEIWFEKLRGAMRANFNLFPKAEMRDVYTLAVNHCIRQINTRRDVNRHGEYLQKVFEIYQEGIDNQVFTEGGVLSHITYKNIANAGLGLRAYDWVEGFLHEYRSRLNAQYQDSVFFLNLASLHFRKSEYGRVLELLTQTEFHDTLHQLDARRMLLRSYFELGEFSALDSLLDSFRHFLRRRRDVGYLRQNYLNLIRFTQRLLKIPAGERSNREKLRQDILQCNAVAEREWLLGKA